MNKGIVKWFNPVRGFGFVTCDVNADIFVHYSDIVGDGFKNLNEGDAVEFDLYEGAKGKQAKNVRKV